jgi:hypothetical protein
MTPQEQALFRKAAGRGVPAGSILRLVGSDDERRSTLMRFCEQLQRLIPPLSIVVEDATDSDPPHLRLPHGIRYHGIPQGHEVAPFIEALTQTLPPLADSLRERLHSLAVPVVLELYIRPDCTYCPGVVRQLIPLAWSHRFIRLSIIDGVMYPELASRHTVQSVPTLVLDGEYRWTGSLKLDEIAALMVTRDPIALTPATLEMMLKQGSAKKLALMMVERQAVFPGLIELLCHEQWPVRLGAMVAVEELNALRPELARRMIDPLWEQLGTLPEAIRGDIFYLFGEIGGPEIIPRLHSVLQGEASVQVREAVYEALTKLTH